MHNKLDNPKNLLKKIKVHSFMNIYMKYDRSIIEEAIFMVKKSINIDDKFSGSYIHYTIDSINK